MKKRLFVYLTVLGGVLQAFSAFGQTPYWWDNPLGYPRFHRVVTTGIIANQMITAEGSHAQFVTAVVDVPNDYEATLTKSIWVQVSWQVTQGTGELITGVNQHRIMWLNGLTNQCPATPRESYPAPDGQGYLTDMGVFSPEAPYTMGRELSYEPITPQPECERLEIRFVVDNNSRLEYQIEVQTVCLSLDWGDAPDNLTAFPDYPTLSTSNGARHVIIPNLRLGNLTDAEGDGQPSANADGDDVAVSDDEDGLTDPLPLTILLGTVPALHVSVSTPQPTTQATVAGWIDYNHDGIWDNATERAVATITGSGNVTLTFPTVPSGYTGPSYARFRLSTDATSVANATGIAPDGEVEDYLVNITPATYDWGDAPENMTSYPSYPVRLANNGARHLILQGLYLGIDADPEQDGQPDAGALGDDNANTGSVDDETGVATASLNLIVGVAPVVPVNITATMAGTVYISGWIDYNGNGQWENSEWASANRSGSGSVNLVFPVVPINSVSATFARFRISSNASQISLPTGQADDGEVEDYPATISTQQNLDFGDLPEPQQPGPGNPRYPTTLAWNGARHVITRGLYMGQTADPDAEIDGQPSSDASGDDNAVTDDEDGILVPNTQLVFREGQAHTVNVTVHTPGNMTVYVNGWVDYDVDGNQDANEIAQGTFTGSGNGNVALNFPALPNGMGGRSTYARFRLSSDQAAISIPSGLAPDGEVEDYMAQLEVPVELTAFAAVYNNGGVLLEWTTQTETENMGFDLYRSESADGAFKKINSTMVPGAGSSQISHDYSYVDQNISGGRTYYYKLADIRYDGITTYHGPINVQVPVAMNLLLQNYPNPFNPQTKISFKLVEASQVELAVYNLQGQQVRNLASQSLPAGEHTMVWDGKDENGGVMPSGVYIYKLKSNNYEESKRMELIK